MIRIKAKIVFFISLLFTGPCLFGQTSVELDNLYSLSFYTPQIEYKANAVKQVNVYFEDKDRRRELLKQTFYNIHGYLVKQINYDYKVLKTNETILVENYSNNHFVITREINRAALVNAKRVINSFWDCYFPMQGRFYYDSSTMIRIKSLYSWATDSSLMYKTFLNDNIIDSGVAESLFTVLPMNDSLRPDYYYPASDTAIIGDTLIFDSFIGAGGRNNYIQTRKYIKDSLLIQKEEFYYNNNILIDMSYTVYYYDRIRRPLVVNFYSRKGILTAKKIYEYKGNSHYLTHKLIFQDDGFIKAAEKLSSTGNVLETCQLVWKGDMLEENTTYEYHGNGLLKEHRFSNNRISERFVYEYIYF